MQNATFKNSNRSFSELRHQILIIFGAKCSFTPVLSTYQLLSKSYNKQKLYFEKNWFLLNRFGQNCGVAKAGGYVPMHQICINNRDIAISVRNESKHCIKSLRPVFGGNRSSICMGHSTEVQPPNNLETDPLTEAVLQQQNRPAK